MIAELDDPSIGRNLAAEGEDAEASFNPFSCAFPLFFRFVQRWDPERKLESCPPCKSRELFQPGMAFAARANMRDLFDRQLIAIAYERPAARGPQMFFFHGVFAKNKKACESELTDLLYRPQPYI
jgi:hypothetical protein